MKDSFEKIYFDLIMESNMKLIEEGKITNSILAGIASLGITGGSLYGLNKASEHSVKNLLDKYPTTQSIPANQSTNTHSNEVVNTSDEVTHNQGGQQTLDDDVLNLTSEEEFIARVLYSETSYKATKQEILMVCQVIANRIGLKDFGNGKITSNAYEVVTVKNAFSCINDPNNENWENFRPDLNSRTRFCCELAKRLMAGDDNFFANKDIVYYHDKSDLSLWKKWVNKFWKPVRLYNTKNFQFYKIVKNKK